MIVDLPDGQSARGRDPVIDAHAWMRALRFEYHRVAQLRRLRVGEILWVGAFEIRNAGHADGAPGRCEAYFERKRGHFSFHALWTINAKAARTQPVVWTWGDFRLLTGNRIEFPTGADIQGERLFRRVCRFVAHLHRHRGRLFDQDGMMAMRIPMWRGVTVSGDGRSALYGRGPVPSHHLERIVELVIASGDLPDDDGIVSDEGSAQHSPERDVA